MRSFPALLLTLSLVIYSQPAQTAGWADRVIDWLTSLFVAEEHQRKVNYSVAQLDSLRTTPTGMLLSRVPDADTLPIGFSWPYLSLTPEIDLERHNRLLSATVVLTDPEGRLPLSTGQAVRILYRSDQRPGRFISMVRRFVDVQEIAFESAVGQALPVGIVLPTIVVADDPAGQSAFNSDWYHALFGQTTAPVSLVHFGDPAMVTGVPEDWMVINSPLRCKESEALLAQALFGAQSLNGVLKESTPAFAAGVGYTLQHIRGGFRLPEQVGIKRAALEAVDYNINRGIRFRAMPGAQLLVMKDGHVVYEQAYGHHTYRKQSVNVGDLYDLASVTKAAATALAVMKLYEAGDIDLKAQVRDYLPELKRKAIGRYRIERLLAHHTGLQSEIPLNGLIGRQYVSDELANEFRLPLGPGRWLDETIPAKVRKQLRGKIDRTRRQVYNYSDLNYYLLQLIVETISGEPMEQLLHREFYRPMQLGRLGFRPAGMYPQKQLVPTVKDNWMRGGLLRGYVHDEGAAMLGGVGGHAGLFSNAHDLGQLFQMLLNGGAYAGRQYLKPETVALFTGRNRYNYRALGFDRLVGGWQNVVNAGASRNTFGHLGFSGTSVWADPENQLVFVLLTNRVHPDPNNDRFQKMRIRGRTHKAVYRALDTMELSAK